MMEEIQVRSQIFDSIPFWETKSEAMARCTTILAMTAIAKAITL